MRPTLHNRAKQRYFAPDDRPHRYHRNRLGRTAATSLAPLSSAGEAGSSDRGVAAVPAGFMGRPARLGRRSDKPSGL